MDRLDERGEHEVLDVVMNTMCLNERMRPVGGRMSSFLWCGAWAFTLIMMCSSSAFGQDVTIELDDAVPFHVHPAGELFTVDVQILYSGPAAVSCRWHDYRGSPLGSSMGLTPGELTVIESPDDEVGYYELRFVADDPNATLPQRNGGEYREYGFVILPPSSVSDRSVDFDSPFGMVHADRDDPYLWGWIKTLTWNTTGSEWWLYEMDLRRDAGLLELPMASGSEWETSGYSEITGAELDALAERVADYMAADTRVLYWELGIEENLSDDYDGPFYWSNLEAKVEAVSAEADLNDPDIQLIYQVVGTRYVADRPLDLFLRSDAAALFDILSIHPYAWPDFPSPETWMPDLVLCQNSAHTELHVISCASGPAPQGLCGC